MNSAGVDPENRLSFEQRLLKWGNSPSVALFWAIIGCICSFSSPMFLFLEEGQAYCDRGPIRMMIMLLICVAMAGLYRVGYLLRHDRLMREEPSPIGLLIGCSINVSICAVISRAARSSGTWSMAMGLELVVVAFFVLLEMAKPAHNFYMLQTFACLPVMAGRPSEYYWDFLSFGWPMIAFELPIFLVMWSKFFIQYYKVM